MKKLFLSIFTIISLTGLAQDDDWDFDEDGDTETSVGPAFFDTRVINSHSVETLEQGTFDVRIAHRFGDMAVTNSYKTLFGFDNSADIQIGLDYGITDKLMIGLHRNKGAGPYTQMFQGLLKYKVFDQQDGKPFTFSANASSFASIMDSSTDTLSITYFNKTGHRFSYFTQLILARNLSDKASIQMNVGLLHRNLVYYDDKNTTLSLGGVAKVKVAKKISIVAEYNHLFRPSNTVNDIEYTDPLGVGVEFKTHAHVFQVNFTNSRGMGEAQFIPYTFSKWSEGEFRMGFTISRHF